MPPDSCLRLAIEIPGVFARWYTPCLLRILMSGEWLYVFPTWSFSTCSGCFTHEGACFFPAFCFSAILASRRAAPYGGTLSIHSS
jgi:hypothetical protein